jgi:hypothetical protein
MVEEYTVEQMEEEIKAAERCGIVRDVRHELRKGEGEWPEVKSSDRLGLCLHQNGSNNFKNYKGTADYHTSKNNHITPDRPMPSTCYDIMIPDSPGPAVVTGNFLDRKYAQAHGTPGDENRHLLAVLVMGGYKGPGYRGYAEVPSPHQMRNLDKVIAWFQHLFGFGDEGLFGHFNFGKSSCPGYWGMEYLEARRSGIKSLDNPTEWQKALKMWNPDALPKYGVDGDWGGESKYWLCKFQQEMKIKAQGFQDDFTELLLMRAVDWKE